MAYRGELEVRNHLNRTCRALTHADATAFAVVQINFKAQAGAAEHVGAERAVGHVEHRREPIGPAAVACRAVLPAVALDRRDTRNPGGQARRVQE